MWVWDGLQKVKDKESCVVGHVGMSFRVHKMEIDWRFSHRIVWEDCVLICLCDMLLKPKISLRLVSQFDVVQYQVQWNPTVMKNVKSLWEIYVEIVKETF